MPPSNSDRTMGLIGLFALICVYLLTVYRGYRVVMQASGVFNQLLAAGLTTILAGRTLVIMAGGKLKLMPLTGIPLPCLSYGASSILANDNEVGLLLRISHNTAIENGE
jgi:cell division protein FtsW (lipid II flippase)